MQVILVYKSANVAKIHSNRREQCLAGRCLSGLRVARCEGTETILMAHVGVCILD